MSKFLHSSLGWLSIAIALVITLLLSTSVEAYQIHWRVWPNSNTTYRRDASFTNMGAGWTDSANAAVLDWSTYFQFNLDNASGSILKTQALGAGSSLLGDMTPQESGHHRTSFTIRVNSDKIWFTGAGTPPVNQFSLRYLLRHEFGHALGLRHSAGANTLMNANLPIATTRLIDQDAINGANFLYNPGANPPIPEGPGDSPVISSGTADDTSPFLTPAIGYKGGAWVAGTGWPNAYATTIAYGNGNQAAYWFWFNGDKLTRHYAKAGNRGSVNIYIDGVSIATMTDYASSTRWQVKKTWSVSNGQHFVEVRKYAGNIVDIDAFTVNTGYVPNGTYDDTNSSPVYLIGGWIRNCCWPNAYQNTLTWSNVAGNAFTLTFVGNNVRYYFTSSTNRGIAHVTIDGIDYGVVDLYAATPQFQQSVLYSNLGAGIHTIHIAVSGQKNPASSNYYIDVDRFDVS